MNFEQNSRIQAAMDAIYPPVQPTVRPNDQPGVDITADDSIINLDTESTTEVTDISEPKIPDGYEGFRSIAMRCIARGQRPFPILIGAKKPAIANFQNLAQSTVKWVDEMAAKFPFAAVGVVAKADEFLFIDEDDSEMFRAGYEKWSGEKFPSTYTTESRPNHRQSHWLQTDKTRAMENISQRLLGHLSVRQHNLYVLAEGSPHPKGSFYKVVDSTLAVQMPDKLVDYIEYLKANYKPIKKEKDAVSATSSMAVSKAISTGNHDPAPALDDGIIIGWGGQNDAVSRFAYNEWVLRMHDEVETRKNVHEYNQTHCTPPMPDDEVETILSYKLQMKQIGTGIIMFGETKPRGVGQAVDVVNRIVQQLNPDDQASTGDFQTRLNELHAQGKTAEEICELSGFNKLVTESLAKVAVETAKAESVLTDVKENWLSKFRGVSEMEEGDIVMVISGVLQEGTCFIGANPGDGKTLIALAMAKAISSGTPLFGIKEFSVKEPRSVIYLIPESRDRAFRKRCEAFRITTDKMKFMARTISSGVSLELSDPYLLEAVRQLKPVVFLDTASRFMKSTDENNSAQNRMLVNDVTSLLAAGAVCVVILHHATKASKKEVMDLQNMLRGTSDLAAMCDSTFGIRKDEPLHNNGAGPLEIDVVNLKDREMTGELTSLRLAASYMKPGIVFPVSYINETGNFQVMGEELLQRMSDTIIRIIELEPNAPAKELAVRMGATEYQIKKTLAGRGYHRVIGGTGGSSPWHQDKGEPCPYAKQTDAEILQDTIKWLKTKLTTGPTGEPIQGLRESEVLTRGDMVGFKEKVLKQAAKRLGVIIDRKTKQWGIPIEECSGEVLVEGF